MWFWFEVMKDTLLKALWNLSPWLRRTTEINHVAKESLEEGPEKPLSEAMKVKPGLHWRSQDVRDTRAIGFFQGAFYPGTGTSPGEEEWCSQERSKR